MFSYFGWYWMMKSVFLLLKISEFARKTQQGDATDMLLDQSVIFLTKGPEILKSKKLYTLSHSLNTCMINITTPSTHIKTV